MTWLRIMFGRLGILLFTVTLTATGCYEPGEITTYTTPKETVPARGSMPNDAIHNSAGAASATAPAIDARMLAGLIRAGRQAWSFKLRGEQAAVTELKEPFHSFIRSVTFAADGKPQWTLPDGWTSSPGGQFTFATIQISSPNGPMRLTVSPTIYQDRTEVDDALLNVNRWRGQLGQPPIQNLDDKDSNVEKIQIDGKTMYLADIVGKMRAGGGRGPMFGGPMSGRPAPGAAPFANRPPSASSTGSAANKKPASPSSAEPTEKPTEKPIEKAAETQPNSADSDGETKE